MRIHLLAMTAVAATVGTVALINTASVEPTRFFSKGGTAIYKQTDRNAEIPIYKIADGFIGERNVVAAPRSNLIAVIQTSRVPETPGAKEYLVPYKNELVIIDTTGTVVRQTHDDVQKCVWSPDGRKLAYITGAYSEEGFGFKPNGIYILDIESGITAQVTKEFPHPSQQGNPGGGYDLNWAAFDSNLYIQEYPSAGGNYVYKPSTGKTYPVPYKGIHFSPDGKFYLALSSEEDPHLYITSSSEDITTRAGERLGYNLGGWASDRPHHLLATRIGNDQETTDSTGRGSPRAFKTDISATEQKTYLLYDVEKDQIVKEWIAP